MAGLSNLPGRGSLLASRYELREPIGTGGMAAVWLADDSRLQRPVAVKLLAEELVDDPVFLARFRREARVAASLSHPNLVSVYDFNAEHDPPFLVMEYVPGPNLAERMRAGEEMDVERLAVDLLRALCAIHRADVIHRDVKPQNVLLADDGRAQLTDFGVARRIETTSITQAGQMPGTARYMAPELMRGEAATASSDLYACGILLRDYLATEQARGRVAALAERMSDPDPARRPRSAKAALGELGARARVPVAHPPTPKPAAAARPTVFVPPEPATKAKASTPLPEGARRFRRTPRLVALAALAGALMLVGLLVLSSGGEDGGGGGLSDSSSQEGGGSGGSGESGSSGQGGSGSSGSGSGGSGASPQASEPVVATADVPDDPERGAQLDSQGLALIEQGNPEAAIPILERAVASFPEDSDDINRAYALFNLGQALRQAGRPEEAIPVLEERLEYADQRDVVLQELAAARAEAQ